MVTAASVSYQPSVAYQGGGQFNTTEQDPRAGQTQPAQAASADSQRGDQRTHAEDYSHQARAPDKPRADAEPTQDSKSSYSDTRGRTFDLKA